ncbi:MAG: hypothetical protein OXJ90_19335 [Spirochaetaceae bacterium]|nr:hypothetical protein [Spirochaetaceae bacterium]
MSKHRQTPFPIGDLFREYLSGFSPVAPSVGEADQNACHTYEVLGLEGGPVLTIIPSGRLVICSEEAITGKRYRVSFGKEQAHTATTQATLTMADEPLEGLVHWHVEITFSRLHPELLAPSKTHETGHISDDTVVMRQRDREITYERTNCVHTQWTLPDVFSEVKAKGKAFEFDLLQNAQVFRPKQVLTYEGESEFVVKDGQSVTWGHFLHLGYGTLPTSYLVDASGVVQIVTGGVNSLALMALDPFGVVDR